MTDRMKAYLTGSAVTIILVGGWALLFSACAPQTGAAGTKSPTPVVNSTSDTDTLTGHVVTINGYTYNCVRAVEGGLGLAVWCDRVDSHG